MASKGDDKIRFLQVLRPAMALLPEVPQAERKVKTHQNTRILINYKTRFSSRIDLSGQELFFLFIWYVARFQFMVLLRQVVLIHSIGSELSWLQIEEH